MIRALGVAYEVRGQENIRKNHGAVVLMNHQSLIDLASKQFEIILSKKKLNRN